MSLSEEIEKYTELTGRDGLHTPIGLISSYFEGYEQGKRDAQQWIPVSERLPKKPDNYPKCEIRRTYYLVSLESECVKSLGYDFDRNEWQIAGSPVTAWMPLPEPLEVGAEGD